MRGIWGAIGCLGAAFAALALAFAVPPTTLGSPQTVIQKPEEMVVLELPAKHGYEAFLVAYPLEGVALVAVEKRVWATQRGRAEGASFVVQTAVGRAEDGIYAPFGPIGTVSGSIDVSGKGQKEPEAGPQEGCRGKEPRYFGADFSGTIALRVRGGVLRLNASHAKGFVHRSYELRCKKGKARHPLRSPENLFSYAPRPAQGFSNYENPILFSSLHHRRRWIEMAASTDAYGKPASSFRAEALEWLRGDVATVRWVEASHVSPAFLTFGTGAPPRSATLKPPAPFSGTARFTRRSHSLRGDLAAKLPGELRVRIGSQASRARVCDFDLRRISCR